VAWSVTGAVPSISGVAGGYEVSADELQSAGTRIGDEAVILGDLGREQSTVLPPAGTFGGRHESTVVAESLAYAVKRLTADLQSAAAESTKIAAGMALSSMAYLTADEAISDAYRALGD
jgi:hypothetical protein